MVRTGTAASESSFKAQSGDKAVVHLATHGILNSTSPLDSEILLAADDKEDGHLSAREIMQLDLNADLVVLSACEMANGRVGAGEGLIGMSWALFVAGSPSTVANLWKTDASASGSLMVDFHRELKSGASKSDALRQAMLATMKKPEFRHPFYWAGFELIGNPF